MRLLACLSIVLLLTTQAAAQQSPPMWSLVTEVRIGAIDGGPTALERIGHIAVNPHTGAVSITQRNEIRVFDEHGSFIHTIGREGSGPGEFRSFAWIGWMDRELVVIDPMLKRVSRFGENGDLLGTETIDLDQVDGLGAPPGRLVAALAGGYYLSLHVPMRDDDPVLAPLIRTDANGHHVVVDQQNRSGLTRLIETERGPVRIYNPLPATSLYAVDQRGACVAIAHNSTTASDGQPRFRVRRVDADANVLFARAYTFEPVIVPPAYVDSIVDQRVAALRSVTSMSTSRLAREVRDLLPGVQPAVTSIVAAVDGSIWLRREDIAATGRTEQVTWWVLDSRGDLVGQLLLPSGVTVLYVEANAIWVEELGDLNVPYATKYRVIRD